MPPESTLCTTSELAQIFRVNGSTVRRWVAAGLIKPAMTTPGGHHRFDLEEVRAALQQQHQDAGRSA